MPSRQQMRFFHGKMLTQICEIINVEPTRDSKEVIKKFLKRMFGVDSITHLDTIGMNWFMTKTSVFCGLEFGITLDMPGEDNIDDMEMKDLLKLIYHDRTTTETTENSTGSQEPHAERMGEGGL